LADDVIGAVLAEALGHHDCVGVRVEVLDWKALRFHYAVVEELKAFEELALARHG
jgi:hypothetical protein